MGNGFVPMIPIIGCIVAAYTLARSFAEITARKDGSTSAAGKVGFALCAIATLFLAVALMSSGSTARP